MVGHAQTLLFVAALGGGATLAAAAPSHSTQAAACIAISKPADLNKIRSNLGGNFCLAADIDLAGVANFRPIGVGIDLDPFVGTFDGRGHVIRNLKINSSWVAGLFASVGDGAHNAVVKNVGLVNVKVVSTRNFDTGGLAATLNYRAAISNSYVTGLVYGAAGAMVGGLVGRQTGGTIQRSHSSATVTALESGYAGGLVGAQQAGGYPLIIQSYATGPVTGIGGGHYLGGLVGESHGTIQQSFAAGPVTVVSGQQNRAGGLVGAYYGDAVLQGQGCDKGQLKQVFSTGPVIFKAAGDAYSDAAGLSGVIWDYCGYAQQIYAAGRVTLAHPQSTYAGGLVSDCIACDSMTLAALYWNTQTTSLKLSPIGKPLTTAQLQTKLPGGFGSAWGITPGVSFPYLKLAGLDFWGPLAMTTVGTKLFTFLPISQREKSEYSKAVAHADRAGLAAVYAMIARAIGITDNISTLKSARIDAYWNDATQVAKPAGALTTCATFTAFRSIAAATPIGAANVIGAIRTRHVAIVRGTVSGRTYSMLATSYLTDASGIPTQLVANDPWTGRQVRIDLKTKAVVFPSGFPIAGFKVTSYAVVTLK